MKAVKNPMDEIIRKLVSQRQRLVEDERKLCDTGVSIATYQDREELINLLVDVLELLKEQEPRVMTPSELQPDVLVWIEVPQSDEIWPALLRETDWFGHPTWAMRGYAIAAYYLHEGYGRDWRCWSAKPTDEQREATPWID